MTKSQFSTRKRPRNSPWAKPENLTKYFKLSHVADGRWRDIAKEMGMSYRQVEQVAGRIDWDRHWKETGLDPEVMKKEAEEEFAHLLPGDTQGEAGPDPLAKEIEKQRMQKERKIDRSMLERAAFIDIASQVIKEACQALPLQPHRPIKPPKIRHSGKEQELVVCLGDIHFLLCIVSEEVGGVNNYNEEVARARIHHYADEIIKVTQDHRNSHRIQKCNVFLLGDMVHGSRDAGKWGSLYTEGNVVQQLFKCADVVTEFLIKLTSAFEEVHVTGVYGNHGRTAKKGIEENYVNWDYIMYRVFEQRTGLHDKVASWNIPVTPFVVTEVLNDKFLIMHGDNVKSWMGLPFYGLERKSRRMKDVIEIAKSFEDFHNIIGGDKAMKGMSKEEIAQAALFYARPYDNMVIGHFHQQAFLPAGSGGELIINNSVVGGDYYSINELGVPGTASQWMFGVHPEYGISFRYNIRLDTIK